MQYIDKKLTMPTEVEKWLAKNDKTQWNISQKFYDGYKILREQLRLEQHGLCCYCGQTLQEKAEIDHVKDRDKNPKKTYDYDNLLLSCKTPNQCNNAKKNQELPLTPLMQECDSEIKIIATGELTNKTERAEKTIKILNLNNRKIAQNRQVKFDIIFSLNLMKEITADIDETTGLLDKNLDKQQLDFMLKEAYGDTPEYQEFKYILNKIEAF